MSEPTKPTKKKFKGRYEGDFGTILDYHPGSGRWRVDVAVWFKDYWRMPHPIFGEFETREFRTLKAALRYRNKVRLRADLRHFESIASEKVDATWEEVG